MNHTQKKISYSVTPAEKQSSKTHRLFHGLSGKISRRSSKSGGPDYKKLDADDPAYLQAPQRSRSSLILPQLQASEKKFFELVAAGDIGTVKTFLQENPGFNINCQNFQGVTALHIAVSNRNEAMVKFLLDQSDIEMGDNVLHAVRDNQIKVLQMLLEKMQEVSPGLEFVGVTHSSEYPDHITPLILAAQCGHYEIIQYLLERGHSIAKPHPPECGCEDCKQHLLEDDQLHAETLRLNLYRAIGSPAYICHSSDDPIFEAFSLSKEIQACGRYYPEFRAEYNELAAEISSFAVEMIAACRSTEEMELILRQSKGVEAASHFTYPRLVLAMHYKQKEFVAHPNIQQIVQAAWHGDWHDWKFKSGFMKTLHCILRPLLLPVITLLCILLPRHKFTRHFQIPLNKMISHVAGYIIFLIIIFIESNLDKTGQKRAPPDSGLELVIILFVVGYIWSCIRLCAILGPKRYFTNLWNWNDLIMYTLFVLTFVFWFASLLDVKKHDQIELERKYWHHLDPILIAEGTFAIAVIMAYFRLLYLCRLNFYLGPLQISLGKMGADMAKYITIFAIIIVAFTAGLCRFYQYYSGMVQVDDVSGIKTAQVSSFVDFGSTLKTFFWALFCMSALESADVIIENLPGETEHTTIINKHTFTEAIGYIAFALFEVLTVIMILNMLIATMSNTFQRVTDNVAVEWVFGKTEFYTEFMIQTTVPSPLNLIPTAGGIGSCLEYIQATTTRPPNKKARFNLDHCCFIDKEPDEALKEQLPVLMTQLVQRYFREKDSSADNTGNEIENLRQELNELKNYLKEG